MEDLESTPKPKINCCFRVTLAISILLLVGGIIALSFIWPFEMEPNVQSATCVFKNLEQSALSCGTYPLGIYVNQSEYKTCEEAQLDMVLECQHGLKGIDNKCPFPYFNAANCTAPTKDQGYLLSQLACGSDPDRKFKVDVMLADGRKMEQLDFVERFDWRVKVNFTSIDTVDCYYTKLYRNEVYALKEWAEYQYKRVVRLSTLVGIMLGWVPFRISLIMLSILAIYYKAVNMRKIA